MIPSPLRTFLPLAAVAIVLAGCGTQAAGSSSSTPTAALATPGATTVPTPPPTPVITGSSAAIINGHTIPLSDYRLLLTLSQRTSSTPVSVKALETQVKQEIVYDEMIREYAAAHHIALTKAEITAQEQQDEQRNGGKAAFQKLLATRYGLTLTDYQALIQPNLLGQKVEKMVAPLKAAKPARSNASAKALAEQILNQLRHGASFAVLARKYSDDTGSAQRGGNLGTIYPNETVPPFNQAAFHAPLRQYEIVHSQFGYHIVEVLSRGTGTPPVQPGQPAGKRGPTAQVRHILISTQAPSTQQQQQQQQAQFVSWLQGQAKRAKVTWVAQVKG